MASADPVSRAFDAAVPRYARRSSSSWRAESPASGRGGTFSSMLCWPSSVVNDGSSSASSTAAFVIDGRSSRSTRFSSTSRPMFLRGNEKLPSVSMRANVSRQRCTLRRYRPRSSVLNG